MNKQRAAKERAHSQRMKLQSKAALERRWQDLLKAEGGFALNGVKPDKRKTITLDKRDPAPARRNMPDERLPAKYAVQPQRRQSAKLSPEMQERDDAAKRHYDERIRPRIGQVGNKMGDQYLTDSDLKDMRAGNLRRRP